MSRAPGPTGSLVWGSLAGFKADTLGFLGRAVRDHGDIVRLRFGPVTAHLVNRPAYIEQILSRNAAGYDKATRSARRIAATTGDSLLSANALAWGRHRRLIQPAFQPRCFDGIGPVVDALTDPMLDRWEAAERVDIVDEMMRLVIAAALRVLFSTDIAPERITGPLGVILADTWRRIEAPLDASMLSPRLHRPAFRRAVAEIDALVRGLIAARRAATGRPDDVLTRLLAAHEAEGAAGGAQDDARGGAIGGDRAAPLTDTELRDAALTLLLSGHETTANALSWAFIHASDRHESAEPAHIFAEAVRLYPSIWLIERRVVAGDTIGGFDIPRGSSVMVSPYLLHRHPDFWPDPERFDPGRFAGGTPRPAQGYLPFGLGQHRCVGLHLANGLATRIIGRVFERVRLRDMPGQSPVARPGLTLQPGGPHWMEVTRRI